MLYPQAPETGGGGGDGCSEYSGLLCYQDSAFPLYQPNSARDCNYSTSGINKFSASNMQLDVYPNPASNSLQITVSNEQITEIKIYDVLGKEARCEIVDMKKNVVQLNISNLSNGVYFINVKTKSGTIVKKFIKV